jgi:hypothetical protein
MTDVVVGIDDSAVNQYEFLSGKDDVNCVNCALLNVKLQTGSQELKSAQQSIALLQEDMNILKKEFMQDGTSGNTGLMNIYKYEEGTFPSVKSKNWIKQNVDFRKKISLNLKKSLPSTIRVANHFEILYNLDEDGTQEELGGKKIPLQYSTDNSDHRNQQPPINELTYAIPVIINGLTTVETNKKNINHKHKHKSSAQQNQGHKIVIIGDSRERLLQNIEINNILVEEQFGFRLSASTDKASNRLIEEILNASNNRRMVGGIFCDL